MNLVEKNLVGFSRNQNESFRQWHSKNIVCQSKLVVAGVKDFKYVVFSLGNPCKENVQKLQSFKCLSKMMSTLQWCPFSHSSAGLVCFLFVFEPLEVCVSLSLCLNKMNISILG